MCLPYAMLTLSSSAGKGFCLICISLSLETKETSLNCGFCLPPIQEVLRLPLYLSHEITFFLLRPCLLLDHTGAVWRVCTTEAVLFRMHAFYYCDPTTWCFCASSHSSKNEILHSTHKTCFLNALLLLGAPRLWLPLQQQQHAAHDWQNWDWILHSVYLKSLI